MKQQTRPFVVEVKKKRGNAARKQSIWGGLDLSAIAAETTENLQEVEPARLPEKAIEPPPSEGAMIATRMMAAPTAQIDQDIVARDLQHEQSEEANIEPARPRTPRRRRGSAETLPRGQQWKRRLPEALRRRK
jgi:hypothetical protein